MNAGQLLRKTRLARGLDQSTLARRAGTTQAYVSRVERGVVSPSIDTLERLMRAMGERLVIGTEHLDHGNSSLGDLLGDLARSPEDRVAEQMELSEFLTGLEVAGRRARGAG
jgi:transcriptional regulator with XRE-family HTH domain